MNTPAPPQGDDFDPKEAIKKIERPDEFAKLFINALKKSKDMDSAIYGVIKSSMQDAEIRKSFKKMLRDIQSEEETKNNLKGLIRKIEDEKWRYSLRKV